MGDQDTDADAAHHSVGAVAVLNGKLMVIGGWRTIKPLPTTSVQLFDPSTNTWSTLASLPTLSGCGVAGVISGNVYVTTPCDGNFGYRQFLHAYDIVGNNWTSLADSPIAQYAPVGGAIGGLFYVAGGQDGQGGQSSSNALNVYNPMTNIWTTKAPMPVSVRDAAGDVSGDTLYSAGGVENSVATTNVLVGYHAPSDVWTTLAPMPTARYGAGAAVIDGKLYVVGGRTSRYTSVLGTLEVFNPVSITSLTASPASLSPANRRTTRVTVTATTNQPAVCSITAVSLNTSQVGVGPDWTLISPLVMDLRAERPVGGVNRVYTLTVNCDGTLGTVAVPVTGVR